MAGCDLSCRPPGHHADRATGGGYCIFNNVACAALAAINHHHVSRVAIVDFDVHHGNGTQVRACVSNAVTHTRTCQTHVCQTQSQAASSFSLAHTLNLSVASFLSRAQTRGAAANKTVVAE